MHCSLPNAKSSISTQTKKATTQGCSITKEDGLGSFQIIKRVGQAFTHHNRLPWRNKRRD